MNPFTLPVPLDPLPPHPFLPPHLNCLVNRLADVFSSSLFQARNLRTRWTIAKAEKVLMGGQDTYPFLVIFLFDVEGRMGTPPTGRAAGWRNMSRRTARGARVERMAEALSGAPPTVVSLLIDGTDIRSSVDEKDDPSARVHTCPFIRRLLTSSITFAPSGHTHSISSFSTYSASPSLSLRDTLPAIPLTCTSLSAVPFRPALALISFCDSLNDPTTSLPPPSLPRSYLRSPSFPFDPCLPYSSLLELVLARPPPLYLHLLLLTS
ncbi:hypothetical protein B0H14DRAFT_3517680 [Mycena olivaceomarginata]|nr:hypothetical protein B0H14DRAFT_3517680 [Mycena olivaceomarginata]